MPDDSLPPADKAVLAFFEIVAFALGWGGVDRLLDGKSLLSVMPIFAATILTSYTGFKWPQIKLKVGNRLGAGQYRSILAVVALLLLTAYDIYDRHVNGWLVLAPWWHYGPILLGVVAVIWLMVGGLRRKEASKLVIHSANYRAFQGGGQAYDVSEFLRKIISGNSLVFEIENHNFVIGDKNFVPIDPLVGKIKRLQATYSYAGGAPIPIERYEHDRLVLPEDSEIQRLTDEIARTKQEAAEQIARLNKQCEADLYRSRQASDQLRVEARAAKDRIAEIEAKQPKPTQYPLPDLRLKIVTLCYVLQRFLGEHGEEPTVARKPGESDDAFMARVRFPQIREWHAKFMGDYSLVFGQSVSEIRNELRSKCKIDNAPLNKAIEEVTEYPTGVIAVKEIIDILWELAKDINA